MSGLNSQILDPEDEGWQDLGGFLESVEKQAYVIALASCREPHTALDIVQDSMFNMVKSYSDKPSGEWRQLFFRILNNRITDNHRKRGFSRLTRWFGDQGSDAPTAPAAVDALDQLASKEIDPASLADASDLNQEISGAMAKLSNRQRQALVHRLWLGLSVKETAIAMGVSEGSVKTHLSRAIAEMRTQLDGFYTNEG